MTDVMLDLETLSVEPHAAVISIGAIMFDLNGTELGEPFFRAIKMESVEDQVDRAKRHISPLTVAWWMDQTGVAQRASFANADADWTPKVLEDFSKYLARNGSPAVWGNGASFDNVILANLYKAMNCIIPWHFTMDRCYRTMKNMGYGPAAPKREGTHHNPLDDARTQAIHLQQITAAMAKGEGTIRGTA